jgi:hypothetical protein
MGGKTKKILRYSAKATKAQKYIHSDGRASDGCEDGFLQYGHLLADEYANSTAHHRGIANSIFKFAADRIAFLQCH